MLRTYSLRPSISLTCSDQANEMLLTERQITAQEACEGGLVTRVFTQDRFKDEVDKVVKHMANLPPQVKLYLY